VYHQHRFHPDGRPDVYDVLLTGILHDDVSVNADERIQLLALLDAIDQAGNAMVKQLETCALLLALAEKASSALRTRIKGGDKL